jgi:putative GTP pyrophosphokinase
MLRYLNDIAGLRIVCSFNSDIYKIADMISAQDDIKVLIIKNYIASPKSNGYKSYHMIVTIPVFMADGSVDVKVEIQIRTIAMDFWASLEHKIYYKFEGDAPEYIKDELAECAKMINALDDRMLALNEAVQSIEVKKNDDKA